MRRFLKIFDDQNGWSVSRRHARRAGIMIFLYPDGVRDWLTGVRWDPEVFVLQRNESGLLGPAAWRRDFVERVTSLGYVPNLEEMPDAAEFRTPPKKPCPSGN